MTKIFSEHVAALNVGSSIDPAILDAIKSVLISELRRRGILDYTPALLGYLGSSWSEKDAIDDLVHDCYIRAIATRLRGLLANLNVSGDIEKLVRRNIRNFVGERQAKFDPVGYAVFQNVKAAVIELSQLGTLGGSGTEEKSISVNDVFMLSGVSQQQPAPQEQLDDALAQIMGSSIDTKLLMRTGIAGQLAVATAIKNFLNFGIHCFDFGTLKTCVRRFIEGRSGKSNTPQEISLTTLEADFFENFRTVLPHAGYEEEEHLEALVKDLRIAIEALPRSLAVKSRLQQILMIMVNPIRQKSADRAQTLDELAVQIGAARSTLHDDIQILRSLARSRIDASANDSRGNKTNG